MRSCDRWKGVKTMSENKDIRDELIQSDFDFFETDEKSIDVSDLLNNKISYKSKAMDIETILLNLKRGYFELPKYQRRYVWEKEQVENLILSLIRNIPIPPLYLYYDNRSGNYVILDGQQRITSLFMYYNSIFYKGKRDRPQIDFKELALKTKKIEELKEVSNQTSEGEIEKIYNEITAKYKIVESSFNLAGKQDITFEKLKVEAKKVLLRKDLDVVFVQCNASNSQQIYAEIFKLINSAGKELSSQEIRMGVYSDNVLYDEIIKFNEENDVWRKIYGNSYSAKDMEYLLRFLALDHYTELRNEEIDINFDKKFSLPKVIDEYSSLFNRVYSEGLESQDEVESKNEEIENRAKKEIAKLKKFFDKFNDVKQSDTASGGNILNLEGVFVAMSKTGCLEKNCRAEYENWISKLDLGKDARRDKKGVKERLNKGLKEVKEYYSYEVIRSD